MPGPVTPVVRDMEAELAAAQARISALEEEVANLKWELRTWRMFVRRACNELAPIVDDD